MSDMDARINESLKQLTPRGGGDWSDVVARSGAIRNARHRNRVVFAVAIAAFFVSVGTTLAIGNRLFGWFRVSTPPSWFSVETAHSKAPATKGTLSYVFGQTLYRPHKRPQRLAFPLRPRFYNGNLAVFSPGGRYLAYQTARYHSETRVVFTPMLYVHDTLASREKLIARGAFSAAWSRDGRIAYFKADRERYDGRHGSYIGQVVVQELEGRPVAWTRRAALYAVLAWVGDEIIVRVDDCVLGGCPPNLDSAVYALNRKGRLRPLHMEWVTALSPDGRYAIGPAEVGYENYSPLARIVRVDSGKVIATLDERRVVRRALSGLKLSGHSSYARPALGTGSWRRDEIVFSLSDKRGSALGVFSWRNRKLVYEFSIPIPARKLPRVDYGPSFYTPFFTGTDNREIVATAGGSKNRPWPHSEDCLEAILACSRAKRSCVVGESFFWSSVGKQGGFSLVTKSSRP